MTDLVYPVGVSARMVHRPAPGEEIRSSEILPIVEPTGIVVGRAARQWCHSGEKHLHPVVHLHILNRSGELYIQKRAKTKKLLPGRWDTAVGGHVGYGERILEALFRESSEELGFTDFNPVHLETYVFESEIERELVYVFAAVGDFELHPDHDEVEEGRWWSFESIDADLSKSIFTPNFEMEFQKIRHSLEALL